MRPNTDYEHRVGKMVYILAIVLMLVALGIVLDGTTDIVDMTNPILTILGYITLP